MKRFLLCLTAIVWLSAIPPGYVQAQNEPEDIMERNRERPERSLIKQKVIPAKKIKTKGNWMDVAVSFDGIAGADPLASSDPAGTDANRPIEISSPKQLAYLAMRVNSGVNYSGKHFRLMADLDLGGREWTPIGQFGDDPDDCSRHFCGVFNGNGHKIKNLTIINGGNHSGLFGVIGAGASIEKLHVIGCYVRGKMMVGGLVGELIGGRISECSVSGTVIASNGCVGGMAGSNNGTVFNCQSSAEVFGADSDTGGLAGVSGEKMPAVIEHCIATGRVTGYWNVGGLVGRNNALIANCRASGEVNGEEWVGGLVGWTDAGRITFCQASGNVRGYFDVGGLVGFNGYTRSDAQIDNSRASGRVRGVGIGNYCIGGLAGYSGGMISDSYATGAVEGDESVGGLIGEHGGKTINCHASGNVSGCFDVGGLVGFNGHVGSKTWLENCHSSGTVTGLKVNNRGIGGLAGYSGGTTVRCYSTGSVTGDILAGGLIGEQKGVVKDCYATGAVTAKMTAGGLAGWNFAEITNSFAAGRVTCSGNVGGLIGQNLRQDATVNNCYYDRETTRQTKSIGQSISEHDGTVTPLTTEELQSGTLPAGFDGEIWEAAKGQYPRLKCCR
jgi:hypothetical protein